MSLDKTFENLVLRVFVKRLFYNCMIYVTKIFLKRADL